MPQLQTCTSGSLAVEVFCSSSELATYSSSFSFGFCFKGVFCPPFTSYQYQCVHVDWKTILQPKQKRSKQFSQKWRAYISALLNHFPLCYWKDPLCPCSLKSWYSNSQLKSITTFEAGVFNWTNLINKWKKP